MTDLKFKKIKNLIDQNKIDLAEAEFKKLGSEYSRNSDFLLLRGEIFYKKKLYYIAIDTLLIALEFKEIDKIYKLLGKIYKDIGNYDLSTKILDENLRVKAVNELKDSMTGIYRIKKN